MRRCANALHWVTQTLLLLFCSFVDLDLAALFMTNKSCGPLLPMPFTGEKAATIKSHTFQAANKCVLLHLNFKFPFIHIKYLSHAKHLLLHFQPISLGITGASPALTWGKHKKGICAFGLSCSSTCFNSFLRMGPDTRLVSRSLLVAALPVSRLPKSPPWYQVTQQAFPGPAFDSLVTSSIINPFVWHPPFHSTQTPLVLTCCNHSPFRKK